MEIFNLSFLTGKLENLPDVAVFQRPSGKPNRQEKICMCKCKCMFVCKCMLCDKKNTVVCGNGIGAEGGTLPSNNDFGNILAKG